MDQAIAMISTALKARLPLLVCGNGGSHADAQHLSGELASRFLIDRPGLPVIALGANSAILTAWSNDYDFESCFAREVEAYGHAGGVVLGISTSGNSRNVIKAFEMARALQMATVALTGEGGGRMAVSLISCSTSPTNAPRGCRRYTSAYIITSVRGLKSPARIDSRELPTLGPITKEPLPWRISQS